MSPSKGKTSNTSIGSKLPHTLLFLAIIIIAILGFKVWSLTEEKNALIPAYDTLSEGVTNDMFTYKGRTLVVHDTPPITATIYTTNTCSDCDLDIASLTQKIQNALPTVQVSVEKADKDMLMEKGIAYVPSVQFDATVEGTAFYEQGTSFFAPTSNGALIFDTGALGYTPKTYLSTPTGSKGFPEPAVAIEATTPPTNTTDTPVTPVEIHAFLSTDCPQCITMHDVLSLIETRNKNVEITYHFAKTRDADEHNATRALACASSLGKGDEYRGNLFVRQNLWKAAENKDAAFTSYATAWGIPQADFDSCMSSEQSLSAIAEQNALFAQYGVHSVPTLFIGNIATPLTGVQTVATIEAQIKKAQ